MSATQQFFGNMYLSIISGVCALVSLSAIQPYLTFVASIVAISSGLYSFVRKDKKRK